jgi:type III pantothenate kinase
VNLVIDIGNTLVKTAVFDGTNLISFSSFEKLSVEILQEFLSKNSLVKHVILSSVINHGQGINDFLNSNYYFIELLHNTKLPIQNLYQTPETLGKDRLACAVGANFLFPNRHVLAIDGGTCIKYDFVNSQNQYIGGGISPGIEMRFRALHQFTNKLPLLAYRYFDQLIGTDTESSILSGVLNGVAEEVKGVASLYKSQYPGLAIVCTGGYVKFLEKIFNVSSNGNSNICSDSFLVLKGLNRILNFNLSQ